MRQVILKTPVKQSFPPVKIMSRAEAGCRCTKSSLLTVPKINQKLCRHLLETWKLKQNHRHIKPPLETLHKNMRKLKLKLNFPGNRGTTRSMNEVRKSMRFFEIFESFNDISISETFLFRFTTFNFSISHNRCGLIILIIWYI